MRTRRLLAIVALAVGLQSAGAPDGAAATRITALTSPGGISAWLVHEPSIPIITLDIAFRGGSALDPLGKEGVAYLVSGLLDEGAGDYDALAFQRRLEELAIGMGADSYKDSFRVRLKTLSRHRDEAFRLLGLALSAPRFDEDAVTRVRAQILNNLARRAEDPDAIAGRTWFSRAFPSHPYGRPGRGTSESMASLEADDLRLFVRRRFARDNVVVGAVGDVSPEELGRLLDLVFGALPAQAVPSQVAETAAARPGGLIVRRKPVPQSVVLFGLPGIKRDDPDYYAAQLMNYVLGGGGLTSRLYEEVREKRGLAYSVYSFLQPLRHAGLLMGGAGTANARVAETIAVLRAEIARLAAEGISADELADAKTYLNGSFPLRLTSNAAIASILVAIQINDLGIDYIERRTGYINAVTQADIVRVAERLLRLEDLLVVVVGDPEGLDDEGG